MKNVALIIPSLKGGGAERVVSLLSQELSKKYSLYLIVFDSNDMAYLYGGTLIDVNIKSNTNLLIKILNIIKRVYRVRKIKKQYNIQSSISFLGSANIINILSRVNDNIVISVRSHLSKNRKDVLSSIIKPITKFLYNKSDKIVAISNGVAKDLIKKYGLNGNLISCIYNPININITTEISLEIAHYDIIKNPNHFTIVNVGRLSNAKGQWHLIRAMSLVKKKINNARLLIIGQGELEEYLRDLVERLGLIDDVTFLGYQENPFKYIRSSDLFVFSSLYEGFGNVILEAMTCGTPVVSTDCRSGPREIISPETDSNHETFNLDYCEYGVLVPVCDGKHYNANEPLTEEEKILAKSIIDLYKEEELRKHYSKKGKQRAMDFDISKIVKEWEKVL